MAKKGKYSHTVLLPSTPFPMRARLLETQQVTLRRWQAQGIYRAILEERRDARPFVIHDGPPYAAGDIHVGIGMNKILKDVVAKYRAMNDRLVSFVPGWDCHGLPIEQEVLARLAEESAEATPAEVRDRCERSALGYVGEQQRLFERLGIFADWERPYLTMDPSYEAAVLSVLLEMVEKGYVYRDLKPLAWCVRCRTALADSEIEHRTVEGPSIWIRFEGGAELGKRLGTPEGLAGALLVWTTTPWSLPGNVAVAAHPGFSYAVYRIEGADGSESAVVLLENRAGEALEALAPKSAEKIGEVPGEKLLGLQVAHPLYERSVPVVSADYVADDSGSGLVHIAPAHGVEDFHIGRESGLEVLSPIDGAGVFGAAAEQFEGLTVAAAAIPILDSMRERGSLAALETREHSYPHCRRCGEPAITRATEQWFLRLDHREDEGGMSLRERALLEAEVGQWIPPAGKARMRGMIVDRPDWCISRQRLWGVPIPAFVCRECGRDVLDAALVGRVRDLVGEHGSDCWFERSAAELLPEGAGCPDCGGELEKGSDILDVWFEAAASWQPVLVADHRGSFPADLCLEGSDQHRGWFQLSLYPALVSRGRAPYRSVVTHGFVVNEQGRRMSRSRGDFLSLREVLDEVPADLVRLFFASIDTSREIALSRKTFESAAPVYRDLRNTFRFLLGSLHDFLPRRDSVHLDDLEPLDLWALCDVHRLIAEVGEDFAGYRFHAAVGRIHALSVELSRRYFDVLKDRLYCEGQDSAPRRSGQTALHSILVALVKLLAPVLPYTCEEVWDLTPGHGECSSVHLSRWPHPDESLIHSRRARSAVETFERLGALREAVKAGLEEVRSDGSIAADSDATVVLHAAKGLEELLGVVDRDGLRDFLKVSEVAEAESAAGLSEVAALPGVSFGVERCEHPECERCRRRDATCGADAGDVEHADLCARCARVLREREGPPERRVAVSASVTPETRPADLARFLRERDIRKLALVNEEGRIRPYYLHPPSQEVRVLGELEPLADYVNASPDLREHAGLLLGLGRHTDVLFGVGIHRLSYGTPLGGTREYAYPKISDLIDNLLRLSWGMSVKNAIAELPHGGGKSIIDTCGWDLKIHREFRREIYRDFGQFTASLFGRYICAEDVGNTNADTREMLYACRHVMCLSQGVGGSGNPSRFTALAAWSAAKAGWKFLTGKTSFEGLTIALQGTGNVGRNLVSILIEADPGIGKLLVADRDPEQIQVIRNILLKAGRAEILEVVSSLDPERAAKAAYAERDDERGRNYVLYAPCDVLVPAAVGNVIHPGNVAKLRCKLILPIANNVYSDNDAVAEALLERGIVDVVENNVNWGGAMAAASEIFGYDEANVARACIQAFDKTLALLEEAKEQGRPPWALIKERAQQRIFHEVHPAVAAARGYKFIGDVSQEFTAWVKDRWLSNLVDVAPERFPALAVRLADPVTGA